MVMGATAKAAARPPQTESNDGNAERMSPTRFAAGTGNESKSHELNGVPPNSWARRQETSLGDSSMRTCYKIDVYEWGRKNVVTKLITNYAAAQLAKSHDAPTGTGTNSLIDSIDLLRAIKSRQVMSFFLE